jgi:hypothetical protein
VLKDSLHDVVSLRPAWATYQDPVSKKYIIGILVSHFVPLPQTQFLSFLLNSNNYFNFYKNHFLTFVYTSTP